MTTGYRFDLSCKACGHELEHENGVRQQPGLAVAVAVCTECSARWEIRVEMLSIDCHHMSVPGGNPNHGERRRQAAAA